MEKNVTAIIILNYNNYKDTINCIESIEKFNTAPIKYIIIDNGSTDKNAVTCIDDYLKCSFKNNYKRIVEDDDISILPYATLLVCNINEGYARGNNKGLKLAYKDPSVENVLILNNDVLFVEDIIPGLYDIYYNKLKDVAILSPLLYTKDLKRIDYTCARRNTTAWEIIKKNIFHYYYVLTHKTDIQINKRRYLIIDTIPNEDILKIELPSGSCMFVNKRLFEDIGSFDPNTFLYWEENILYKKTESIKKNNYLATKLKCIHLGAMSTSLSANDFRVRVGVQSQMYYVNNYSDYHPILCSIISFTSFFYRKMYAFQKKVQKIIKRK